MNKKRFYILIEKYLNGTSSQEENEWLEKWFDRRSEHSEWDWKDVKHKQEVRKEIFNKINDKAVRTLPKRGKWRTYNYQRSIAALLIIGFAFGFWFMNENKKSAELVNLTKAVAPGTKAATLQMGNGEVIFLDDREEGLLSQLDDVEITKMAGGAIHYNASDAVSSGQSAENTLFIPRGGQYKIILPDGTKVWMNSETTLIYPTRFAGNERKVKLIGEAYFEVAHNKKKPFIVVTASSKDNQKAQEIEVLGTHFNVNSYEDEVRTTLLKGSVRVKTSNSQLLLQPGEQARFVNGSIQVVQVDIKEAIAWRNGRFMFDNEGIESIMRKISRWYDVDVEFQSKNKDRMFYGTVPKYETVDKVLNKLELTGAVSFIVEERRIIVK